MNIIFAGTPEFAATLLQGLIEAQFNIVAVYTQPDRPAGRGRQLQPSPVKQVALTQRIPIEQPLTLKTQEAQQRLSHYAPDLMVVVAYGLRLPSAILKIPQRGCLNVHASLLPRWRGAAPIQRAILAGDPSTGISLMHMDEGLDTGPVLATAACPILPEDTTPSLTAKLLTLAGPLLHKALHTGPHKALAQDHAQATYAHKLTKTEGLIDWQTPAAVIERKIRALIPWPVAYTHLASQDPLKAHITVRIWAADLVSTTQIAQVTAPPGTLLQADKMGILIQCNPGVLKIKTLQLPGGRILDAYTVLNNQTQPLLKAGCQFV
jgi:methionyl-tRNA formyltransferase